MSSAYSNSYFVCVCCVGRMELVKAKSHVQFRDGRDISKLEKKSWWLLMQALIFLSVVMWLWILWCDREFCSTRIQLFIQLVYKKLGYCNIPVWKATINWIIDWFCSARPEKITWFFINILPKIVRKNFFALIQFRNFSFFSFTSYLIWIFYGFSLCSSLGFPQSQYRLV